MSANAASGAGCELRFDADLVLRAARGELGPDEAVVREHLERCDACGRQLLALSAAKRAWAGAVAEPEPAGRLRDRQAMARFQSRGARRPLGTFLGGAVFGGAVVAALMAVWLSRAPQGASEAALAGPSSSEALPAFTPVAPASASVAAAPRTPSPSTANAVPRALVVKRACGSCRSTSAEASLEPGAPLPDGALVDVPAGGKLLLAFSLAEALVDPEIGVTVEGPARAGALGEALRVERGRASVVSGAESTLRTPHATIVTTRGRLSIDTGEDGTRVVVLSGGARITTSSGEVRDLGAGERVHVAPDGGVTAESTPAPPPSTVGVAEPARPAPAGGPSPPSPPSSVAPPDRWASAMRALDARDRTTAERELRQLVSEADASSPLRARASFALAELELVRGDVVEARPLLEALLRGPEEQLAEDAATLLGRSYPTPGERALVWARYLGTLPEAPRRDRALLERVRALVANGDVAAAKAAAHACDSGSAACAEAAAVTNRRGGVLQLR